MNLSKKQIGLGALVCTIFFTTSAFANVNTASANVNANANAALAKTTTQSTNKTTTKTTTDKNPGALTTTVKPDQAPPPTDESSDPVQEKAMQDFVNNAADYIKQNGKAAAMNEFNKKKGNFTKGNAFIFAVDFKGVLLADPFLPEQIGTNQLNAQTVDGEYINRDMIALAKKGSGWILYKWVNPVNQKAECKKSYVLPLENSYFISSGYYYAPYADGTCAR